TRDEVGLRIDLDNDALGTLKRHADESFGGHAASLLRRLGQALLAQPVDRGLHVTAALTERRLAVHHARAGLVAQVLDHGCGNGRHCSCPCSSAGASVAARDAMKTIPP